MQERNKIIYMTFKNYLQHFILCFSLHFVSLKWTSSEGKTNLLEMEQTQFTFFSVRKKTEQSPETPLRCFISVFSVSHSDTGQLSRFSLNMHYTEGNLERTKIMEK
jgi:hypothetical protein